MIISGTIFCPAPLTQTVMVMLALFSVTLLKTFRDPFSAINLAGVCWNCLPVSSQFQIQWGLSFKFRLPIIFPRTAMYLFTIVGLSMRAKNAKFFWLSKWKFWMPLFQSMTGAPFLNAATFMRLQRIPVLARSCLREIPIPLFDASRTLCTTLSPTNLGRTGCRPIVFSRSLLPVNLSDMVDLGTS